MGNHNCSCSDNGLRLVDWKNIQTFGPTESRYCPDHPSLYQTTTAFYLRSNRIKNSVGGRGTAYDRPSIKWSISKHFLLTDWTNNIAILTAGMAIQRLSVHPVTLTAPNRAAGNRHNSTVDIPGNMPTRIEILHLVLTTHRTGAIKQTTPGLLGVNKKVRRAIKWKRSMLVQITNEAIWPTLILAKKWTHLMKVC